jgi:hypothetical protein
MSGVQVFSELLDDYTPVSLETPGGEVFVWSEEQGAYLDPQRPTRSLYLETWNDGKIRPDTYWEITATE